MGSSLFLTLFSGGGRYNVSSGRGGSGVTVVYLDRVLLLNLLVDYLLLLTTAQLAGIPLRRGRLALCAAVGALYAGAVFLPGLSWLSHPLCRTAGGAAMALAAWRREAHPWRLTALFFLLAGGLGGLVLALGLASGSVAAYVGRLYRAEISWPVLLGAALGFFGLLHLVFRQAARHGGGEIMDATISIGGQSRAVRVLHDTGNTLRSPVTGQPVLVLEQTSLGGLLPPEVERIVTRRAPPEERMAQLHATDLGRRFSLLPFCSIGAPEGLLLAVCSDSVQIGGTTYPRTLVALSPGPVSDGGGYQALWGGTERGSMKKLFRRLLAWLHSLRRRDKVMYIGGSDTLPPPLPREEETEVIARLEQGDPQARQTLIERNLRLVVYIARRFENTGINIEDLISIGTIGLIKAINTFRADKNIKLATYASRCIENEILMFLRKNSSQRTEVSFDEPLNTDWDGKELLLSDVLGTEGDVVLRPIEADADRKLLSDAVGMLSQRERDIITMRFGLWGQKELTQKEVADRLGISQSYISRLEKRIILRLRREIVKMS